MSKDRLKLKSLSEISFARRVGRSLVRGSLAVPAIAGVLAAIHFQSASAAPVLSTNLPPISPALPEVGFSVIRVFGALALVLALFLAGVWVFKNWQRLALQRGRSAQLEVVEMKHLGGKHALYVVAYQQQRLLLASSPNGVTLVSHLPPGEPPGVETSAVTSPNFVQVLQQAVQGKP